MICYTRNFIGDILNQYTNECPSLVEEITTKLFNKLGEKISEIDIVVDVLANLYPLEAKYYYRSIRLLVDLEYPDWLKIIILNYIIKLKQGITLNLKDIDHIWQQANDLLKYYSFEDREFIELMNNYIDSFYNDDSINVENGRWLIAKRTTQVNAINNLINDNIRTNIPELNSKDNIKKLLDSQEIYIYCVKNDNDNDQEAISLFTINFKCKKVLICGFKDDLTIPSCFIDIMIKKISSIDSTIDLHELYTIKEIERISSKGQRENLSIEELKYIYEIDQELGNTPIIRNHLNKLLRNRNNKNDLSRIFECHESQVTNRVSDVLNSKREFKCFYGDLNLNVKHLHNVKCPEFLVGNLRIGKSQKIENVILPAFITKNNNLCFESTCYVDNITLPVRANEIIFPKLVSAKKITFPQFAKKVVFKCVKSFEECILPIDSTYTIEMPVSIHPKSQEKSYTLK